MMKRVETISIDYYSPQKNNHPQTNRERERERVHSSDPVVLVAGDVEPCAGANEGRIPALEHVIRVGQAPLQRVECVAFGICGDAVNDS